MQATIQQTTQQLTTNVGSFMAQVFGWMSAGLFITAAISAVVYYSVMSANNLGQFLVNNQWILIVTFIVELLIVIGISGFVRKLSPAFAMGLFAFYSALNGLFIGLLVLNYTLGSVFTAFVATAGTFTVMAIFGAVTKRDLTGWGNIAIMGLFGIIIGSVVNIFIASQAVSWILTYVGIVIFIVLIAYDTQKLKKYAAAGEEEGNLRKYAILGALALYLDFINLFIRLLAIFGKRN